MGQEFVDWFTRSYKGIIVALVAFGAVMLVVLAMQHVAGSRPAVGAVAGPVPTYSSSPRAPAGPATSVAVPAGTEVLHDDFDRPNGTDIGAAPTGQTWNESGAAGLQVEDGRLAAGTPGAGHGYGQVDVGSAPSRMHVSASWGEGAGGRGEVTLISGKDPKYGLGDVIHLVFRTDKWTLQLRQGSGDFEIVDSGPVQLSTDGTEYEFGMWITGDTVIVETPDGARHETTDTRVSDLHGQFLVYEVGSFPGTAPARIESASAEVAE